MIEWGVGMERKNTTRFRGHWDWKKWLKRHNVRASFIILLGTVTSCTERGSKIWNNLYKFFWSDQSNFCNKHNKSKFSWLALLFEPFFYFIKIQHNLKRNDKESMICLTPKPRQSFFVYSIKNKEKILTEKELFKVKWGVECSVIECIFMSQRD